jgi:hypothetical protein
VRQETSGDPDIEVDNVRFQEGTGWKERLIQIRDWDAATVNLKLLGLPF